MVWTAADEEEAGVVDLAAVRAEAAVLAGTAARGEGPAAGSAGPDGGQGAARPADAASPAARADPPRRKSGAGSGPKPAGRARRRDPWRTAFFGALALAIAGGAAWA